MSPVVGRMHVGHPRSWDWDQQKAKATSVKEFGDCTLSRTKALICWPEVFTCF